MTGACGYKGSVLVPKLLERGHLVTALDTQWFGNYLPEHPRLVNIRGDIIRMDKVNLEGVDAVVHLASIANDPTGDLNPKLTWETNCLATMTLADRARRSGVKQFIYASSGSVYGIKEEARVTEDLELLPISEYNKTKMVSERALLSYQNEMVVQIIRPATVCGVSPRMRFDVSVNLLTMAALTKGKITVFGGAQVRPNIHIQDIADVYIFMLENPQYKGIYNAGFENISIMDIAKMVAEKVEAPIEVTGSSDPRSYRVNSDRLLATGFSPQFSVSHAIDELIEAWRDKKLEDRPEFHNLKWMTRQNLSGGIVEQ